MRLPDGEDLRQFDYIDYRRTFVDTYREPYKLFAQWIKGAAVQLDPIRALDVGAGDGWTVEQLAEVAVGFYIGIEPSLNASHRLQASLQRNAAVVGEVFTGPAQLLLESHFVADLARKLDPGPNLILCNTSVHQICKTTNRLCDICAALATLADGHVARIFIGDYHYPDSTPNPQVQQSRTWIQNRTGQIPTDRCGFVHPQQMQDWMAKAGARMVRLETVKAHPDIALQYYLAEFQLGTTGSGSKEQQ